MDIATFAEITKRIILKDGFSEFLPTACFPERKEVRVLAGDFETVNSEPVAIKWAMDLAKGNEEFLIAYKSSTTDFKIIKFNGRDRLEDSIYTAPAP